MRGNYSALERGLMKLVDSAIRDAPSQWEVDRLVDLRAKIESGLGALDEPRWNVVIEEASK